MAETAKLQRRRRRRRHAGHTQVLAAVMLVAVMSSGCYRSLPLTAAPAPGTRVAATLTVDGRNEMERLIGPDVVRVEGEATQVQPDRWELNMLSTLNAFGRETPWNREPILFSTAYFGTVEQRRLDTGRTALAATVITGIALFIGRTWVKGFFDGSGDDGPGQQPGH